MQQESMLPSLECLLPCRINAAFRLALERRIYAAASSFVVRPFRVVRVFRGFALRLVAAKLLIIDFGYL
jgi:hypothetical protein